MNKNLEQVRYVTNRDAIASVRYLIGAAAYACIEMVGGGKIDILLSGGQSGQNSLRNFAADQQRKAERHARLARLAVDAAAWIDGNSAASPSPENAK